MPNPSIRDSIPGESRNVSTDTDVGITIEPISFSRTSARNETANPVSVLFANRIAGDSNYFTDKNPG